jgi:hypothetical protein
MKTHAKLLISATVFLEALLLYFCLTGPFPPSGDDYSYLYEAKLLAAGKLYAQDSLYDEANPLHDCVATKCLTDHQGRRFSKYPPGCSALEAVGAIFGAPWLVNPLLGAILTFLILLQVERRMGNHLIKVAGWLLILCFFFCYYAASFRSHIATAVFIFGAFVAYDTAQRRVPGKTQFLFFWSGALLGYSSMIRYIDWLPLAAFITLSLFRRRRLADFTAFAFGFVTLSTGNLWFDWLLSGDPLQTPTALSHSTGMHDRLMISWIGFRVTAERLASLFWLFPPALLLIALARRYRASLEVRIYLALFLANIGIYFFYPASAGGPGPRYLLAYFGFLVLAIVDLYDWIRQQHSPALGRVWNVAIALLIVDSLSFVSIEGSVSYRQRDLTRTVLQSGGGLKILFLKNGTYRTDPGDLTRNPPIMASATNLYFNYCDNSDRDALVRRFPGREVFLYEYPGRLEHVEVR